MDDLKARSRLGPKSNRFEDFDIGRTFEHHWERTINEGDNALFTTLAFGYIPLYFNAEIARSFGHDRKSPTRAN
jgi:itaconyl-CoA hydratase